MTYTLQSIGQSLAEARRESRWNQRDLADQAGTTQARISKIENGETDPKVSTLIEIARTLGLEIVLVPLKHLPAVKAIIRHDPLGADDRSSRLILDRLANQLVQLRHHYPDNDDLKRLDRITRELKNFRLTGTMEKPFREILGAVQRVNDTPALVGTLSAPAVKLQRLRNELAHSNIDDGPTQRPAYRLDDEDDTDD